MEIVFATNNRHKLEEVQSMLPQSIVVLSLNDIGWNGEIPEDHETFRENALQKARTISDFSGRNVFADDSGLEVEALNGKPGVFSARYAGEPVSHEKNNLKLLAKMEGVTNRSARFRSVFALILDGETHFFEGTVDGKIDKSLKGSEGFGYDPLFIPEGYSSSFAELGAATKNQISHRKRAMDAMCKYLANKS